MAQTRTILVTGASSGIGHEVAMRLIKNGNKVIGITRDPARISITSDNFQAVTMDFAQIDKLPTQLNTLTKQYQEISAIICCAGQGRFGGLEEFSYQQIQELITVNVLGQIYLTRAILPGLKKSSFGNIIFIGSEAALTGKRQGTIYCASKFALRGFAQALREECASSSIRVSIINPGMVKTAFFNELSFQHGPDPSNYILPEDVANAVSFIVNTRKETVIDELNLSPLKHVLERKKPK